MLEGSHRATPQIIRALIRFGWLAQAWHKLNCNLSLGCKPRLDYCLHRLREWD